MGSQSNTSENNTVVVPVESLFEQVEHGRIWPLEGGVHPPACKEHTSGLPITKMPLPKQLILPLKQHIGEVGKLLVSPGDKVLKGQMLTEPVKGLSLPIHAPTSGTVVKVEQHTVAHPSGLSEPCLFLEPDGEDLWVSREPLHHFTAETPEYLVNKIKMAGISGLGGAGFPAYVKSASLRNINYLIINATECEPYITADESLIQRSAEQIIQGIDVVSNIVSPNMILIGIEDDKPQAIKALKEATEHRTDIHIRVFPAKYPSGGEKQLIKILTGEEVPTGGFPVDVGILVHNIGTLYAIYKAVIEDEPLISRVVTVTGESVENPQNVEVLLGTPVDSVLEYCGFKPWKKQRVIMGGPMMGFTLPHTKIPLVKISNCILAPGKGELPEPEDEMDCIRCGACADACPVKLLPQQMFWYAKAKDLDTAKKYNIKDCIECGACAYVCPSQIPLVQYYRVAKAEIRAEEQEKLQAEKAKQRFEARKARLEREAEERAEKQRLAAEKRKQAMSKSGASNAVADALARVKAKKAQQTTDKPQSETDGDKPLSPVQAAVARAKAKKAQEAEREAQKAAQEDTQQSTAETTEQTQDKPLTGAAAAVAKAKARKAAQQAAQSESDKDRADTQEQAADPKKAAIAAAVAKAKARKQKKADDASSESVNEMPEVLSDKLTDVDEEQSRAEIKPDKKAAIAAAVAKAKARKQQKENESQTTSDSEASETVSEDSSEDSASAEPQSPEDAKKARIAAAVAKAKARKQQKESQAKIPQEAGSTSPDETTEQNEDSVAAQSTADEEAAQEPQETLSPEDAKKARIAAAVAKAKARKEAKDKEKSGQQANDE